MQKPPAGAQRQPTRPAPSPSPRTRDLPDQPVEHSRCACAPGPVHGRAAEPPPRWRRGSKAGLRTVQLRRTGSSRSRSPRSWRSRRCSPSCRRRPRAPPVRTEGAGTELRLAINGGVDPDGRMAGTDGAATVDGVIDRDDVVVPPVRHPQRRSTPTRRPSRHPSTRAWSLDDGTLLDGLRARDQGRGRRRPDRDLQGQVRRHAGRHRPPQRRLDDDPVVGEQPEVEGRPVDRPGPAHPAGLRPRRTPSRTRTPSTRSPSATTSRPSTS